MEAPNVKYTYSNEHTFYKTEKNMPMSVKLYTIYKIILYYIATSKFLSENSLEFLNFF